MQDSNFINMEINLSKSNKKLSLLYFITIVLPFLLFYWIMPFVSNLMMGNDFRYSVHQQMEMLFSIKRGSFPLYHPTYALGQSSITLTWSQVFHPISHLSSIMPGYWNGKALQWYEFFKILSLGLTHLVLFFFLRNLRLNLLFSFIISFITVYNMRMLDLFRFGASLEAYTGYLLLCIAIGWYFLHPTRVFGPLSIIIVTYLLVVSGHPQHMYYGLLGAGLFLLVAPFFLSDILDQHVRFNDALWFWIKSGFFLAAGILLASVYILPFVFDFLPTNTGRADATYEWSVANIGLYEVLGNFFMPYFSDVHGAFGGSSLIILALLLPLLKFFKIKIPRSVWITWGIIILTILYMFGDKTPVYKLAWEFLPFLSAFRHQGRASLIIPIFIMMLLVWVIIKTESHSLTMKLGSYQTLLAPYPILALIAIILICVHISLYLLFKPYIGEITPGGINNISLWKMALIPLLGIASLLCLIVYGMVNRARWLIGVFLLSFTLLQIGVILRYGTYTNQLEIQPTFWEKRALREKTFEYKSAEVINMQTRAAVRQVKESFIEPFLGKIFTQIIPVSTRDEAYIEMQKKRLPQQLFVEGYGFEKAKRLTDGAKDMKGGKVKLVYSSFNRLRFYVYSEAPAFFGLSYPYTGHWRAWVNGEKVRVYRANGAAHAVEIPGGESFIEFRYWSDAFFLGMVISCTTFAVIGLFVCFRALKGFPRMIIGIVFVMVIGMGGFMLWYNTLYNGENLETEYTWTYAPPLKTPNIAYSKKTLGYYPDSEAQLRFHGSNAVDGDKRPGSGFVLRPLNEPLIVDLNQNEIIKTIILYGELKTEPEISLSQDGLQWQKIRIGDNKSTPLRIIFEKPQIARFVKVKASEFEVGIDEIEVYGPEEVL